MKNMKKILMTLLFGVVLLGLNTGCKKLGDFGDTNVNPNGSSTAETSTFISTVQSRLGSREFRGNDPAAELDAGYFAQYFAQPTYPVESRYSKPDFNFTVAYTGALKDVQTIIDRNTDPSLKEAAASSGSNASQLAIARIMKAYIFWEITDKYGDIPYFDALKGAAVLNPKYDPQELIYKDLIKELTEAVAQFDGGVTVKGDLIYAGNEAKWKKFANSLRMLMSLRLSKRYPNPGEYAAVEFGKAVNDPAGFISTNADNFSLLYPGNTTNYNNPWFGTGNSLDNAVAKTYTDALTGLGDTRLSAHATNGTGVPYGLDVPAATGTTWARILAPSFKTQSGTYVLIGAASVLLAKAEALERGWIPGGTAQAKLDYEAGVKASFAQWGVTIPADYLTSGPANYESGGGVAAIGGASVAGSSATTNTKLARIHLQQWIAFYPNAVQGWSNWRRTGIPDLRPTIYATNTTKQIPRRLPYGDNEYNNNAEQLAIQIATMSGGDTQDTRVWWDKQ